MSTYYSTVCCIVHSELFTIFFDDNDDIVIIMPESTNKAKPFGIIMKNTLMKAHEIDVWWY